MFPTWTDNMWRFECVTYKHNVIERYFTSDDWHMLGCKGLREHCLRDIYQALEDSLEDAFQNCQAAQDIAERYLIASGIKEG